jgi:hypothetical protein
MVLSDEDIVSADAQEFDAYRCFAAFSSISGKGRLLFLPPS